MPWDECLQEGKFRGLSAQMRIVTDGMLSLSSPLPISRPVAFLDRQAGPSRRKYDPTSGLTGGQDAPRMARMMHFHE